MKIIDEFKEFIAKGNVVDMAVGVVVGAAFKAIVDSLVKDIIMPCVSVLTGKINIADLKATIIEPAADGSGGLVIPYGNFIQQIVNFLIIAFVILMVVKFMNAMKAKLEKPAVEVVEVEEVAPAPTTEELLGEIRDLLKEKQ